VSLSCPSAPSPPSRLLIVDDDPLIRLLARERLGTNGFEVVEASGGAEGVEVFGELLPDLVLLDVEMPEVDGFDVCKAIRGSDMGRHVPILILTGRDDIESIEHAYQTGATDFVTKPINWLILAHRIRYMLRASESFMAVRSQQVRLDEVQQHALLGSWEVDVRTRSLATSRAFRSLVGLGEEIELLPLERMFDLVHPEDRPGLERKVAEAFANRDGFTLEHRILARGGAERIVHTQARVRTGAHDECLALEGFTQDVTDRRRVEEQVRLLAFSDSLTGLSNRAAFKLHLERAIQRTGRTGRTIGILYLDLDNFKRVNDTLGHTAGDRLLRIVADLLVGRLRESDVVARDSDGKPHALISRLGGDEFTILLEDLSDSSDASLVAERVLEAIARPVFIEGHEIRTTASVGIAIWPQDGADLESLLRNADAAMYHAKELGRANYQYYRRSLNSDALDRLELESDLSRAIQDDRLLLNFQPQLQLARRRISACEALARWPHSCRGLVPPATFIPIAERSGMISALGEWVLRQACTCARAWQEGGHPDLRLAVNVSPSQIMDERLVATIEQVLHETRFDPRLLEFEITESAFLHDASRTLAVFEQLQGLGCQISLDDFGTHYSALTNLKRFAVQSLKIDRSFVSGIGSSREDEAIITAIMAMARSLGIRVVAEGIETEEQLAFLREHQCDEVQGFLISEPLDAEDFGAFLDQTMSERACREKCSLGS
jgi:diguanylate cyclase (GGDEF)-like protein/PAS domain S-box-containing protein